jgi:hypothetical protein
MLICAYQEMLDVLIEHENRTKPERPLKIYIAGPYTAATKYNIERNVRTAIDVGIALFKKGHFPFIPHLTHYLDRRADATNNHLTWEEYMMRDLAWLEVADALFFMGESEGANMEREAAQSMGLDVYYMLSEVPDVRGTLYESGEGKEKK